MSLSYAPGVRVEIRDAEWRIKCVDRTSDGEEQALSDNGQASIH